MKPEDQHKAYLHAYEREMNDVKITLILRRFRYSATWYDLTRDELSQKPELVERLWKLIDDVEEFDENHPRVQFVSNP